MITVSDVSLSFGGQTLFKDVNLLFTAGNCYGIIGANGAGKSTFLKILCGSLEPTTGSVTIKVGLRMSVLKQDHFAYDEYTVEETVIMGNPRLYEVMQQKDALYAKEDFTEEDGNLASELEAEFAELGGWEAQSDAAKLVQGLGLDESIMTSQMSSLAGNEKVKILLAHKQEIKKFRRKVEAKGMTIVPLEIYIKNNLVKMKIALARGKAVYDKKEAIKARDLQREQRRELRNSGY